MKYRIITNGKLFRIQYRCFLFFYFDVIENKAEFINDEFCGMIKSRVEFTSPDQAIEWILNEQPPKEPKETWRVVDMDAPRFTVPAFLKEPPHKIHPLSCPYPEGCNCGIGMNH